MFASVRVFELEVLVVLVLTDGHWSAVVADAQSGVVHAANSLKGTNESVPNVVCWSLSHVSRQASRQTARRFVSIIVPQQSNFVDSGVHAACTLMADVMGHAPGAVPDQCAASYRTHVKTAIGSVVDEAPAIPGAVAAPEVGVVRGAALTMGPAASALGVSGPKLQSVQPVTPPQRASAITHPPGAPVEEAHGTSAPGRAGSPMLP